MDGMMWWPSCKTATPFTSGQLLKSKMGENSKISSTSVIVPNLSNGTLTQPSG